MSALIEALPIPIEAQIACVVREIGYRERCYPRWASEGRMTPQKATAELDAMRAVLETLQTVALEEEFRRDERVLRQEQWDQAMGPSGRE